MFVQFREARMCVVSTNNTCIQFGFQKTWQEQQWGRGGPHIYHPSQHQKDLGSENITNYNLVLCKHVPTHQQSCNLAFYYNTAADLKGYLWLHLLAEIGNILKHATHEAMMRQRVEHYASCNTVTESF